MSSFTGWRRPSVLAAIFAATLAAPTWAEPAPPFAQLLGETADAPRIAELDADAARAEGLARQAHARPNPYVSLYGENFAGTAPYGGSGRTETTLQINQPIEFGGKRSARIAAGEAEVTAARARGRDGRVAYAYDLARAYVAVEIAARRIDLAEDEVEEARSDLGVARAMVAAGKETRLRQLRAETELNALGAELDVAKAGMTGALARLSALAGGGAAYTGVAESLLGRIEARSPTGPADPMRNTAWRAASAEQDAAGQRLVAERKRAIPDVTFEFGVRRLEADHAVALVGGVSVPLPLFDRNRGNIAAAAAEARAATARAELVRLDAEAEMRAASAEAKAAEARAAAAGRTLSTAEEAYRLARIAYEEGKAPLSELIAARHGLGVARGVVLDAATACFDARAMLARLQGLTITGEPVQ